MNTKYNEEYVIEITTIYDGVTRRIGENDLYITKNTLNDLLDVEKDTVEINCCPWGIINIQKGYIQNFNLIYNRSNK